jgi:hypothetical protein
VVNDVIMGPRRACYGNTLCKVHVYLKRYVKFKDAAYPSYISILQVIVFEVLVLKVDGLEIPL